VRPKGAAGETVASIEGRVCVCQREREVNILKLIWFCERERERERERCCDAIEVVKGDYR